MDYIDLMVLKLLVFAVLAFIAGFMGCIRPK